eukprot:4503477-Alexandrium_andersonii.AAC.1
MRHSKRTPPETGERSACGCRGVPVPRPRTHVLSLPCVATPMSRSGPTSVLKSSAEVQGKTWRSVCGSVSYTHLTLPTICSV